MLVGVVLDHEAPGRDAWHGDVRLDGVGAGSEWFPAEDVYDQPPAQRQVEPFGQRAQAGVGFDL